MIGEKVVAMNESLRWTIEQYDSETDDPPQDHHIQDEDPPDLPPLEEADNG
jgi:hypothetical protein